MAVLTVGGMVAIQGEQKGIHPFFGDRSKSCVASLPPEDVPGHTTKQALKQCGGRRVGRAVRQSENVKSTETGTRQLEIDLNYERRKRRKSGREIAEQELAVPALANGDLEESGKAAIETRQVWPWINGKNSNLESTMANDIRSSPAGIEALTRDDALCSSSHQSDLKPQKILRLNPKTGTIGSPPAKNSSMAKAGKNKKWNKSAQLVVKIKYGRDESVRLSIGKEIDLLNGVKSGLPKKSTGAVMLDLPKPGPEVEPLKQTGPQKPTHPFFLGKTFPKSQPADTVVDNSVPKISLMLGEAKSLRKKLLPLVAPRTYSFGNVTGMTRFPGAVAPCWPPRDMLHVRGQERNFLLRGSTRTPSVSKKLKYSTVEPLAKDSILEALIRRLDIYRAVRDLEQTNADAFAKPEECLRIPKRQFKTGLDIQQRVRRELNTRFSITCNSSEDELQGDSREYLVHPAIVRVYELIPSTLSAFDRSDYETQSWIHKYAPCSTADILQTGKEALILKEWLQKLTVILVDDGLRSRAVSVSSRQSSKPVKRKRKSKLEGFIISSDEEDGELDEISEDESRDRGLLKTVVRANHNKEAGKAVVISGPSGCGKTAMVYAVAKELDFEVFEINSSSRRSGKDILEKVGDMTRNHLVNRIDGSDAEVKSQGPMNILKTKTRKHRDSDPEPHKPPKAQKQSLILLEEVDILFEEDKQFWPTVMTLVAQSKRPIIMTCNDEALVPLQALPLHAIIRLAPPPVDLAVDYMLLVAAAEGHILQRRAVKALFDARQSDLRASMTELDYWCQLGVGDRRGGFDWFCPRWPPGCDVDAQGNTIRVVSDGTYAAGMGWLGRDLYYSCDSQSVREELFNEARDNWHIDVDAVLEGSITLSSYESYVDSMSLADLLASGCDYQTLDATVPPLPAKARDDFVLGYELLQAETQTNTLERISSCIRLRAWECVHPEIAAISESWIIKAITDLGHKDGSITRQDFNLAFDSIAERSLNGSSLEASAFDRETSMIAVDIAPFIRSIVAHDIQLRSERIRLSNLLSEGGKKSKRLRTTRSSLSALEGGARRTTRPEKYFAVLNSHLVMKTGLQYWRDAVAKVGET